MLVHNSLEAWYQLAFIMQQRFGYSLTEYDNMTPFEKDIYGIFIDQKLERERMEREQRGEDL